MLMSSVEEEALSRVISRYRREGYLVESTPQGLSLPSPHNDLRVDAIARRESETVAIEVKDAKDVTNQDQLESLARAIKDLPGWHLRVVIAGEEDSLQRRLLTPAEVRSGISEAKRLLQADHQTAALLWIAALFEAVARQTLERRGRKMKIGTSMAAMARDLVFEGMLNEVELGALIGAITLRSELAHGFRSEVSSLMPSFETFEGLTGKLLQMNQQSAGAAE
jgi:hypothetical protein